jgi:hypothetical protein
MWNIETEITRATATSVSGMSGTAAPRYLPAVIAASAVGAANPIVVEIHPDIKPTEGWYIRDI